jgi:hypothetical protein
MATTTPNYGWPVPTSTDLVKDGATAIEDLGDAIDATVFTLSSGVIQVKSTAKTDTFSMSSTTFADITNLTVTITPTSATNKILILFSTSVSCDFNQTTVGLQLSRGGTAIGVGDVAGSRTPAYFPRLASFSQATAAAAHGSFLDSPATTSAITYALQIKSEISAQTVYVNRSATDTDAAAILRGISTITVMEVKP